MLDELLYFSLPANRAKFNRYPSVWLAHVLRYLLKERMKRRVVDGELDLDVGSVGADGKIPELRDNPGQRHRVDERGEVTHRLGPRRRAQRVVERHGARDVHSRIAQVSDPASRFDPAKRRRERESLQSGKRGGAEVAREREGRVLRREGLHHPWRKVGLHMEVVDAVESTAQAGA